MRRDSKLSYQEMDAILKRSVELQVRRGSSKFSEQDVLEAARELGIDAHTAAEVVAAHLARRASAAELAPRPFDTRIQLEVSPDTFSLTIPPIRASLGLFASAGLSGAFLAFIAYWTSHQAEHDASWVLFTLVAWVGLLSLLGNLGLSLIRKTTLTLNREVGELRTTLGRRRPLLTPELNVHIDDVDTGDDDDDGKRRPKTKALLLDHGIDTIQLMYGYSRQEQRWIESELRAWLHNV